MSWSNNVLGGITEPRIYSVDDNFCTNPYFNVDTTDWTQSTPGILTRGAWNEAYGEYVGVLTAVAPKNVSFEHTLDLTPESRTFMASLRIRAGLPATQSVTISVEDQDGNVFLENTISLSSADNMKRYVFVAQCNDVASGSPYSVTLKIQINISGSILFDHVYFTEVFDTIDISLPKTQASERDLILFEKVVQGSNELWSGLVQEFGKKWRPRYVGNYDYLTAEEEESRQQVAEASKVFVLPHRDVAWGFFGIWSDDIERRYSFGKYLGHRGQIPIMGIEFLRELPYEYAIPPVGILTLEV